MEVLQEPLSRRANAGAAPTAKSDRYLIMDVLRGFAYGAHPQMRRTVAQEMQA